MRVIAGSARRKVIEVAGDSPTRPFLEAARGALFNALGDRILDARVLDLYAGSGALGLEALSRGAKNCLFIESDPSAFSLLKGNITHCGFSGRAGALRERVGRIWPRLKAQFDIIFLDPPFPVAAVWTTDPEALEVTRCAPMRLSPNGLLVFRVESKELHPPVWPGLALADDRAYGRSRVCWYVHS